MNHDVTLPVIRSNAGAVKEIFFHRRRKDEIAERKNT